MDKYIITKDEIEKFEGVNKTHFLNENAKRRNKSLGDLTGLQALGFHIIEVQPGHETTEYHFHYHEEECVYILEGTATSIIGNDSSEVKAGDFIGYRAGGLPHTLKNTGTTLLRCIVAGQRLDQDVAEYPNLEKRIFRQKGLKANVVNISDISEPDVGKKA